MPEDNIHSVEEVVFRDINGKEYLGGIVGSVEASRVFVSRLFSHLRQGTPNISFDSVLGALVQLDGGKHFGNLGYVYDPYGTFDGIPKVMYQRWIFAEEVVDFSVDFLCAKLLKHAEAGVPHDEVTFGLEEAIIDHFGLPNSVQTRRLAHPAYHVFLKNYALRGSYPYKDGNPVPETHYWRLRNGFPDSDKFKVEVLKEYRRFIEANLGT